MNSNHVGANYPDSFGNYVLCSASAVPINAASNTAAIMSVQGTSYIVRRVTISNANASCATANVSIINGSPRVRRMIAPVTRPRMPAPNVAATNCSSGSETFAWADRMPAT